MKKLLYISPMDISNENFGGAKCALRNYRILKNFFEIDTLIVKTDKERINSEFKFIFLKKNIFSNFFRNLFGYSNNFSIKVEKEILKKIKTSDIQYIFIEGSSWGKIIKKIKKIKKNIVIMTFFHNIEYEFTKSEKENTENIFKKNFLFIKLRSIYYNEMLSAKYSDYCFNLNLRDAKRLEEIYNRKSNFLLPITFEDKLNFSFNNNNNNKYLLFVGSLFYANYVGIKWFIENVMEKLQNKHLIIIGKDFESKRKELERSNVKVIGTVENVEEYYKEAEAIVMPIFSGAGMKVKVAEALMYGKIIYGTTEAFEGYEIDYKEIGGLCNTSQEFIEAIVKNKRGRYNKYSREIFISKYSTKVLEMKLKEYLQNEKII